MSQCLYLSYISNTSYRMVTEYQILFKMIIEKYIVVF